MSDGHRMIIGRIVKRSFASTGRRFDNLFIYSTSPPIWSIIFFVNVYFRDSDHVGILRSRSGIGVGVRAYRVVFRAVF